MNVTLNKIRKHSPCKDGWEKLLKTLGKTKQDDEPLSLITILNSNGLNDAIWCLRVLEGHDKEKRLFAVWCARQVQHLMRDERSIRAIDVAEAYANGLATKKELDSAYSAAVTAYGASYENAASAYAACDAAYDVDAAEAYAAAAEVACDAASTASAAAYDAAYDAAYVSNPCAHPTVAQEAEFRRVFS